MNEPATGMVKNTVNYRIIRALSSRPGEWLTSAQICQLAGVNCSKQVAHKLKYIVDDVSSIERVSLKGRYHMYRYTEHDGSVMIPSKRIA